jgi:hypothetical protein
MLTRPDQGKPLIVYLSVANEALIAVMVKEKERLHMLVYFISKALQGPDLNYQKLEKLVYALLITS